MRVAMLILAGAIVGASGCAQGLNERLVIGTRATASFGGDLGPGAVATTEPMAWGEREPVDRGRWATTVVVCPIDGVVHGATLRLEAGVSRRAGAEVAGAFPTVEGTRAGAREKARPSEPVLVLQELGRSVSDVVMMPVRGVVAGFTGDVWSPRGIWKRTRPGRWSSGRAADE